MSNRSLILLIIFVIIVLIIVILYHATELPRYSRLKVADIHQLDEQYNERLRINCEHEVVISLSTTPQRIHLMKPTINSLLEQSVKVDRIILNVPYKSRKDVEYEIPSWLKGLHNVQLNRIDVDEGPASKLLPAMRIVGPHTRIVVVDDDILYNSYTVQTLVEEFDKHDEKIAVSNYGVNVSKDIKVPETTLVRAMYFLTSTGRKIDLLQGFSGFVVTPAMFPQEVYDLSKGPKAASYVDDVWFSCWLGHNDKEIIQLRTLKNAPLPNIWKDVESLGTTSPPNYQYDLETIKWFIENTRFRPLSMK